MATDHVIESFRNDLWPGYKTGEGIEPALCAQFHPLEEALAAMGVAVWPMVELEADDALASAARARRRERAGREGLHLDARQGSRAVRPGRPRRAGGPAGKQTIRDAAGVRAKFGVEPILIPDFLALVGDAADGYPGIPGIGTATAARLLNRHGADRAIPGGRAGRQPRAGAAVQDASPRCGPTRRSSATWRSCAGGDPTVPSPPMRNSWAMRASPSVASRRRRRWRERLDVHRNAAPSALIEPEHAQHAAGGVADENGDPDVERD